MKADLGYSYGVAGNKDKAREILNEFLKLFRPASFPAFMIAEVYIGLGDNDITSRSGCIGRWTKRTWRPSSPAIRCSIHCARTRGFRRSSNARTCFSSLRELNFKTALKQDAVSL